MSKFTESDLTQLKRNMEPRVGGGVVGTHTRRVPMTGNVPNETVNTTRMPRLAGNKVGAPVPIRGEAAADLDCAGRGEAYNHEAGLSRKLRSKEMGRSPKAGSNPAPSPYKSKWEASYASKLELEKRAGIVFQYWYEPFSIWLPGKIRFKPDFMVKHAGDPVMEIIEVKGWSKNRRDGITRLKIAAALFPCFVWRMVYRTKGGGWDGEYL